ncbi:uncharacterized protein FRV6_16071 [Fusarium oxysporum]|uniref:Uncharacterized protein n=1 Tax=Fusarium oxysporum TaxID=5507 RepID=A0A2H3TTI5_FUSOX|nr:uncharacterized protein FRV6_16071 [Fusarium oxysporum]
MGSRIGSLTVEAQWMI